MIQYFEFFFSVRSASKSVST